MNKKIILLLSAALLFTAGKSFAQTSADQERKVRMARNMMKTATASPLEDHYDVRSLRFDIAMDNTSTHVAGNVLTRAEVVFPVMSEYVFELDELITIDSVLIDGVKLPVTRSGDIVTVALPAPYMMGTNFNAQVFYQGAVPTGAGFFTNGVIHENAASGTMLTYTMSDPFIAKDWWPCKQSVLDKIDTVRMAVTVPDSLNAGCNGMRIGTTYPSSGMVRYEWLHQYPIAYYLISVAIAPYKEYHTEVHFEESSDIMPIQNFLYDSAGLIGAYKPGFDSIAPIMNHFSRLFGRYPFWKEKYGHCVTLLSGGMEHQTMTTIGTPAVTTMAHELAHQWWGDHVTYYSWRDMWLSEGFATYSEQLFLEHFGSIAAAKTARTSCFNSAMSAPGGTVYVDDTTDALRIFDGRLTYNKGASVVAMLRFYINNDSLFFAALRNYQLAFSFSNAGTDDFTESISSTTGIDISEFIDQWIYKEGYPTYNARWNQIGNTVYVKITQSTSVPASVPLFKMPLELRFAAGSNDTIVRIQNYEAEQYYSFTWDRTMTAMSVDPENKVMNKGVLPVKDVTLNVNGIALRQLQISPNPAKDTWTVSGNVPVLSVTLTDANGRQIWTAKKAELPLHVPAGGLTPGIYMLRCKTKDGDAATYKMVKQ